MTDFTLSLIVSLFSSLFNIIVIGILLAVFWMIKGALLKTFVMCVISFILVMAVLHLLHSRDKGKKE
jgi:uncharacterized membrane protein